MPEPSLLTILHIGDLHFTRRRVREQSIVVDALIKDIKANCIGHRKPDIIIFTGDLVHAAGVDSHADAYDFLLEPVAKAAGCSDERVYIVPGNHEVEWSALERFSSENRNWRAVLGSGNESDEINDLYSKSAFEPATSEKFANFLEIDRYLRGTDRSSTLRYRDTFVAVDHIAALNVDIVTFNTAVLSTGGHKGFEKDERNLVVPEYAMLEAVRHLSDTALKIFLTHHPLAMLSEQSSRQLGSAIEKNANLHLFGHMHDPQPKNIVGLYGEVLTNQCGALFVARKTFYSGYSLITVDRSSNLTETVLRSYYKDRNVFDDGIDVVEGGRWWPSHEARQHFRRIGTPVDESMLRQHLAGPALVALQDRDRSLGGTGDVHEKFVSPPLRRTFMQEMSSSDDTKVPIDTSVELSDLQRSQSNLILYAKPEYGRTTILREIRYSTLSEAESALYPRLPVMIDFKEVGASLTTMLRKVRGGCELLPDGHDIEALLTLGYSTVLIDDVEFQDGKRMKVLREFVAKYPKARYIFSSSYNSVTKLGAFVDPEMPISFDFVEVREFRRNEMRQMLARDERCTDVEVWLDRLQNEIREINLPFTAANGSILIEILSEKYNFTPINRSVLMEQFVDMTLRKAAIEQSRRDIFDYTNKTDLLSHVAGWMAREDQYVYPKEAVRSEMKSYIDARGLKVSIDALMAEFLSARIFVSRPDDAISFRYRGVLEYFIALRMTNDREFRAWVLEEDRYLQFGNEIQYYAGKLRNDSDLVRLVAERHKKIIDEALAEINVSELTRLETLQIPRENDSDGNAPTDEELIGAPLSRQEKDAELDIDLPEASDNQEVVRDAAIDVTEKVTPSLMLYSGLIKNMELMTDGEKRRHLDEVWMSWSKAFVSALKFAPKLAKDRRVRINGALYEVRAPHALGHTKLLRQMMILLPHVFVRMISGALGTEKLERQLVDVEADSAHPRILDFLRVGVVSDLRLTDTPKAIAKLAEKLRDNRYLLWSLIVHVFEMRRMDRFVEEHFVEMEGALAAAIADLKGGSIEVRSRETSRQIARLERDRLVKNLKKDKELTGKLTGTSVSVR